jgi:hypothetical protein
LEQLTLPKPESPDLLRSGLLFSMGWTFRFHLHGAETWAAAARVSTATAAVSVTVLLFVASGMPSEQSERVLNSYILALRSKARGEEQKKIPAVQVGIFSARP